MFHILLYCVSLADFIFFSYPYLLSRYKDENRYLVITSGWEDEARVHACIIHLDIIDDKIWIQSDSTEDGIALDLLAAGIPKENIVLGFHQPKIRQYTGFAVA